MLIIQKFNQVQMIPITPTSNYVSSVIAKFERFTTTVLLPYHKPRLYIHSPHNVSNSKNGNNSTV